MQTFVRVHLLKVVSFAETNTARLLIWLRKWHIFNACFRSPRSTGHVRVNKFATRRSDLFYRLPFISLNSSITDFGLSILKGFIFLWDACVVSDHATTFRKGYRLLLIKISDLINIHRVVSSRLFVFNSSLKAVFYRAGFA